MVPGQSAELLIHTANSNRKINKEEALKILKAALFVASQNGKQKKDYWSPQLFTRLCKHWGIKPNEVRIINGDDEDFSLEDFSEKFKKAITAKDRLLFLEAMIDSALSEGYSFNTIFELVQTVCDSEGVLFHEIKVGWKGQLLNLRQIMSQKGDADAVAAIDRRYPSAIERSPNSAFSPPKSRPEPFASSLHSHSHSHSYGPGAGDPLSARPVLPISLPRAAPNPLSLAMDLGADSEPPLASFPLKDITSDRLPPGSGDLRDSDSFAFLGNSLVDTRPSDSLSMPQEPLGLTDFIENSAFRGQGPSSHSHSHSHSQMPSSPSSPLYSSPLLRPLAARPGNPNPLRAPSLSDGLRELSLPFSSVAATPPEFGSDATPGSFAPSKRRRVDSSPLSDFDPGSFSSRESDSSVPSNSPESLGTSQPSDSSLAPVPPRNRRHTRRPPAHLSDFHLGPLSSLRGSASLADSLSPSPRSDGRFLSISPTSDLTASLAVHSITTSPSKFTDSFSSPTKQKKDGKKSVSRGKQRASHRKDDESSSMLFPELAAPKRPKASQTKPSSSRSLFALAASASIESDSPSASLPPMPPPGLGVSSLQADPSSAYSSSFFVRPGDGVFGPSSSPLPLTALPPLRKMNENTEFMYRLAAMSLEQQAEELFKIAKEIRGKDVATDNCVHLTVALLKRIRTGRPLSELVPSTPSRIEDYSLTPTNFIAPITVDGQTIRTTFTTKVKITIGEQSELIERPLVEVATKDGKAVLSSDEFEATGISYKNLNQSLIEAAQKNYGVSMGMVDLRHIGNYVNTRGHNIFYFATWNLVAGKGNVFFVDLQRLMNGEEVGPVVFDSLEKGGYEFLSPHKEIDPDTWSPVVFSVADLSLPVHPRPAIVRSAALSQAPAASASHEMGFGAEIQRFLGIACVCKAL